MSDFYDFDLVSIGSGPAGQRAAVRAAKLGKRAAVVEERRAVGGVCIDTGTIPSKTLRETVMTFSGLAGKGDRLPWAKLEARPTCQQLFAGVDTVITREIEVIYAIPGISMVGAPEHELTGRTIPYETGVARYREIARGQILGDHGGMFKMLFHQEDRRLLGIHCIGTGATELVHVGQAVLGLGGGLGYFLHTVFTDPTLAECYKGAALDASNKLRF